MGGAGNDQGGRWPVGIWFAMVGVSAGTVASFALIGWTFARDLYGGGDGAEPLDYEPETIVIEAEETPAPAGAAGADEEPLGPDEPGAEPQLVASPAEPRAERITEGDAPREQPPALELVLDETEPPQLVPVEDDPCDREEAALEPDPGSDVDLEPERESEADREPDRGRDSDREPDRGRDSDREPDREPDRGRDWDDVFDPEPDRGRDWNRDHDRVADTTADYDLDRMRAEIEDEYDRYLELKD